MMILTELCASHFFFFILGGKKEAAKAAAAKPDASKSDASKSEASTSGQKLTPQKSAQEMSKLSLKDESQHQRQGGPSTSKQSEQSKPPPSEPVTKVMNSLTFFLNNVDTL